MKCELFQVEGTFNIRDLGGYVAGPTQTASRRFIRSGSLSNLTLNGKKQLRQIGVSCIIDLRSTMEVRNGPDRLYDDPDLSHYHIPMLDYIQSSISSGDLTTFPSSMAEMYIGILDNSQQALCRVFKLFATQDNSTILFHCTAGKDRTGVIAMLLLLLAGVSQEDVEEDYSWSEQLSAPFIEKPEDFTLPAYLFESRKETIRAAIDHVNQIYGGAKAYLQKIGLPTEYIETIQKKLLQ